MHSTLQLEGLAVTTHDELKIALPVDAFQLADSCELDLTPVSRFEESFDGREVKYNGFAPHRHQQAFVALCVARYLLQRGGYYPDYMAVTQLARALMLPWDQFIRDLKKRCGIAALRKLHPHVPTQLICARIGDVHSVKTSGVLAQLGSLQELGAASRLLALAAR